MTSNYTYLTSEEDKERIRYLYFERLYSLNKLCRYFNGKYSYEEINKYIKSLYD